MILSVYQHLSYIEERYSGRTAFQYYNDEADKVWGVTYKQYVHDVRQCAMYLRFLMGDTEKKHVGILAKNSYHYAVCLMGTLLSGAVVVPLNLEEAWENINYEVDFADIDCLLHDGVYCEREQKLKEKYERILYPIEAYREYDGTVKLEEYGDEDRLSMILFTSGTTGLSKGVMLSMKNLYAPVSGFMDATLHLSGGAAVRAMLILPLYHIAGAACVMTWLTMGACINICQELKYLYRDLRMMHAELTLIVPMVLQSFYKDLLRGKADRLGGLKTIVCGAAFVDTNLFQVFRDNGIAVFHSYGLTEICGGGTNNCSQDPKKDKSVGRPSAGCQLKLEQGEICLKSDAVMLGYYKDPEATKEAVQGGWLHTGDLGYLDEDGYLYLTGRKKNLIILSGGENVSAEELENLLLESPLVEEVVVKQKNDKICAEIFCVAEKQDEIRSLVTEINCKLPYWKRITAMEFRTEPFLRTASGKIRRG